MNLVWKQNRSLELISGESELITYYLIAEKKQDETKMFDFYVGTIYIKN